MQSWKQLLWQALRFAVGGSLMFVDVRLFALYAFALLLLVDWRLDHLRATQRVYQFQNDLKLLALMEHADIPVSRLDTVMERARTTLPLYTWGCIVGDWKCSVRE
jgi:hypothetical protein